MEELRVPKRKTSVELVLEGGEVRRVQVFLTEFAATHAGAERLSDLLNGTSEFVPALNMATDKMTFLNRTVVAVARVAPEVEGEDESAHTIPTEHEVEITLIGGQKLRGLIAYVLPPDRSRLTDYLNDGPRFIRLVEQDHVALVNKRHVALVEAL